MENINEFKIRLSGTANIEKEITLEKDVDISIKNAETISSKLIPNYDGSLNKIINIKITERSEVSILSENNIIKSKKKGSQSQLLRTSLIKLFEQQYQAEYDDFETFYKEQMSIIIKSITNRLI